MQRLLLLYTIAVLGTFLTRRETFIDRGKTGTSDLQFGDIVPNLSQTQLLAIFDSDPGRAEEKYRELFQDLVRYSEWNRSLSPEDLAQEALKRGFARLQDGAQITTDDPRGFFFGIARNLLREDWRTRGSEQLECADQEHVLEQKPLYNLLNSEQRVFLHECLRNLSDEEFKMLMAYVEGEGKSWALRAGISLGTLHTRVHRLRRQLEDRARLAFKDSDQKKNTESQRKSAEK